MSNQGETTIAGGDAGAQVSDVTETFELVLGVVDRISRVIFHHGAGYIQTMKADEDTKLKTMMNSRNEREYRSEESTSFDRGHYDPRRADEGRR